MPWTVGFILALCIVLASLWTCSTPDGAPPAESARRTCGVWHEPIWGSGGAPTAPTIRSVRLTNKGTDVLRYSKIGLYTQLDDATSGRIDWLEQNKASVRFYTNGLAASKGDTIDTTPLARQSYETVSRDHYVALPAETALVIDLNDDVPITAVRMGAVESTTAPDQRRLLVETSRHFTDIADATFTPGFVRRLAGQANYATQAARIAGTAVASQPPPASHIGPSGIYELATTPTGFATVVFPTAFTVSSTSFLVEGVTSGSTLPCTALRAVDPITVTATPYDANRTMTVVLSYSATATGTGAVPSSSSTTLDSNGQASIRPTIGLGTFYLFARVTAPSGAYRDIACATPVSTLLSPLWPSTSTVTSGRFYDLGIDYLKWRGHAGNFGSVEYWNWYSTLFDDRFGLVSVRANEQGVLYSQYRSNFFASSLRIPYVLTFSYAHAAPSAVGGQVSDVWWFRWGYKQPITVRRYALIGVAPVSAAAQFTLTGYADISFANGTVIATVPGSSVTATSTWTTIRSPTAFSCYELRQTVGPFVVGFSVGVRLGN